MFYSRLLSSKLPASKTSLVYFAALHKYGLWLDPTGAKREALKKKRLSGRGCAHIPAKLQQSSTHLFDQSWAAPAVYRLLTL